MADSNRQKSLSARGAETIAFFFVSLFVPASVLFVPLLNVGSAANFCDDEFEFREECIASVDRLTARGQRRKVTHHSWSISYFTTHRSRPIERKLSIAGHRLKHDLLAPLTC
jgi:hypothetical protein